MIASPSTLKISPDIIAAHRADYIARLSPFFDIEFIEQYSLRDWEYFSTLHFANLQPTDKVLDVGGACSFIMAYAQKYFQQGYIIDDASMSSPWYDDWVAMMTKVGHDKVEIIRQNAKQLPFADNYFDKVFTFSAFEHFQGDDDIVCCQEVYRVLKDDGCFTGTVDFNPLTENPRTGVRTYTYRSLHNRIINPAGFKLSGEPCYLKRLTEEMRTQVMALFFKLQKG